MGLTLPLSTRPTPGTLDRRAYDIVDARGRLIATLRSDHFESATYRVFDAEAVARLWAEAPAIAEIARRLTPYADEPGTYLANLPCDCRPTGEICDACTVHGLVLSLVRIVQRAAGQMTLTGVTP